MNKQDSSTPIEGQETLPQTGGERPLLSQPLNRRQFIRGGLVAATLATLPALAGCREDEEPTPVAENEVEVVEGQPTVSGGSVIPAPVDPSQPPIISSNAEGVLETTFEMGLHQQPIPMKDGTFGSDQLRAIVVPGVNDQDDRFYPTPTFRVKRGDTIKIHLKNNLPPNPNPGQCEPMDNQPPGATSVAPNCFHDSNTTNFHFHGAHVFQTAPGDDVLMRVDPGETFDYEFPIHSNQAPGTHWYHPHKHGATAIQVINGMCGALIVEGDFDFRDDNGNPIVDNIFMLQQISPTLKAAGTPIVINGRLNPTVQMRPGEVQRWRVVSATMQASAIATVTFQTPSGDTTSVPEPYQIAQDGVQYSPDQWDPDNPTLEIDLAPGNRSDFLVQAPTTPGTYQLVPYSRQAHGVQSDTTATPTPVQPIMTVTVAEDGSSGYMTSLPTKAEWPALPDFLCPVPDAELMDSTNQRRQRALVYSMSKGSGGPAPNFFIDCKQFDPARIDHCMVLGTAEEWIIYNTSTVAHPFHIHLNPFFVTDIHDPDSKTYGDGEDFQPMRWQDTIQLPAGKFDDNNKLIDPGYIIFRSRFIDFTGPFVIHCHILGHEDRGMMARVGVQAETDLCPPGTRWTDHQTISANADCGVPDNLTIKSGTAPTWGC